MPPVVARTLRGCLALAALLVSAWGQLRAAVERPFDDGAERLGPMVADASICRSAAPTPERDAPLAVVHAAPAPLTAASTPSRGPAPARSPVVVLAAPTPRLGSANGARAP